MRRIPEGVSLPSHVSFRVLRLHQPRPFQVLQRPSKIHKESPTGSSLHAMPPRVPGRVASLLSAYPHNARKKQTENNLMVSPLSLVLLIPLSHFLMVCVAVEVLWHGSSFVSRVLHVKHRSVDKCIITLLGLADHGLRCLCSGLGFTS